MLVKYINNDKKKNVSLQSSNKVHSLLLGFSAVILEDLMKTIIFL